MEEDKPFKPKFGRPPKAPYQPAPNQVPGPGLGIKQEPGTSAVSTSAAGASSTHDKSASADPGLGFKGVKWRWMQEAQRQAEEEERKAQSPTNTSPPEVSPPNHQQLQQQQQAAAKAAAQQAAAEAAARQEREAEEAKRKQEEAERKEAEEREAAARKQEEEARKEKAEKERLKEEARKRKAAAAAAKAAASVHEPDDLEDDMFITLPTTTIKQQQEQEDKHKDKDKAGGLARKASRSAVQGGHPGSKASAGPGQAGDAGKADKPGSKAERQVKRAREVDGVDGGVEAGKGASVPSKKPRAVLVDPTSDPSSASQPRLQAHNSLTASTDKAEAHAASAERKDDAGAGADGGKPSKRQRLQAAAAAQQPSTASQPKSSQQQKQSGKGGGEEGGRLESKPSKGAGKGVVQGEDGGQGQVGGVTSPRRGANIVAVKPEDNSIRDPSSRKPPVVVSGGDLGVNSLLQTVLPAVVPEDGQAATKAGAGSKGERGGKGQKGEAAAAAGGKLSPGQLVGGKDGSGKGGSKAGDGASGKQAKAGAAGTGTKQKEKGGDKSGAAKTGQGGGKGDKEGAGKGLVDRATGALHKGQGQDGNMSAPGAARCESGTQRQDDRLIDCILDCGPGTLPAPGRLDAGSVQSIMKAKVDMSEIKSPKELWAQLSQVFKADVLPDRLQAHLIYMDADGDWLLVTPDDPWSNVSRCARKLLISHKG